MYESSSLSNSIFLALNSKSKPLTEHRGSHIKGPPLAAGFQEHDSTFIT